MFVFQKVSIHLSSKRQISADSVGTGANLNYNCLVLCSWFFEKIIFSYTTIYFIRDMPIVSQYSTPARNGHVVNFDRILKSTQRIQNKSNNGNPSQSVIICDMVFRKNKKLVQILKKYSQKWATMNEDSWLSGQMTNVMMTFMA